MKAYRTFAVTISHYRWGSEAYDQPATELVTCPDCNARLTVSANRRTIPEHLITGTHFRCDASAAQFTRRGDSISLQYEDAP